MRIENEVTIDAPLERVWDFLMDIPTMSSCIPGVEQVEQVDETKWNARIKQKVGPLSVGFDCQISIVSVDKDTYSTASQISGRDSKLGSGMKATMSMSLAPQDDQVVLKMTTDADISGKIAQYGHGIIKQRASAMTEAFGKCVNEKIGATVA